MVSQIFSTRLSTVKRRPTYWSISGMKGTASSRPSASSVARISAAGRTSLVAVATVIVSLVAFSGVTQVEQSGLAQTAALLAVAAIVSTVAEGNVPGISIVLGSPLIEWIGRLSYSLYLWQQVFCWSRISGRYAAEDWPTLVVASFLTAAFSYYVVEQPALALRQRLELRWFPREKTARTGAIAGALAPLA